MIAFIRKLAWLARRRAKEDQLYAELQFHLDEEAAERQEAGLPEEQARRAARRDLGNLSLVREDTRAVWSWRLLEQLLQDLRYAVRTILHNPAFTVLAVLTLALGIGANTAIYSFMDALLMRRLPVADPASLVVLNWHVAGKKSLRDSVVHDVSGYFHKDQKLGTIAPIFPYPAFELLRQRAGALSVLFAYHPAGKLNVMIQGQAESVAGEYVSGDYFRGLGVAPAAGRPIIADDDRAGAPGVVMLSYAFAQRRFGDAAGAAGRPVLINNVPFTAIGVTPPEFFGVDPAAAPDFYLPMHADLLLERDPANAAQSYLDDHYYWIEMMGRLNPGVTLAQAQAALGPVFEQWVATTAASDLERKNLPEFVLRDGTRGLENLRRQYSRPVYVLLAMVGLILALACANVANLLLARADARRREMAVRLSMGAGRWRVVRQLLTESLLLASLGGVVGIVFARWGIRALTLLLASGSDGFPLQAELHWHVLGGAAALTLMTGLLFGLAPALQATRVDVMPALKQSKTGESRVPARLRIRLSQILVVSQIAISLLLLLAAGLFARTLANLQSSLIGDGAWAWPVVPYGAPRSEKAPTGRGFGVGDTATHVLATGPGFFTTMRISLLAGREFDERDHFGSPPVAIVNQAWVKLNLENRNPVGQHLVSFWPGRKPQDMEIIGVAKNARYDELTGNFPAIVYMPFAQNLNVPVEEMTFLLRSAGDPLAGANAVREIMHQADARIPVTNLETQAARIDQEMSQQILFARLCSGFAMLALAIACVGLYSTVSYSVARRTGEIGIRMALGAQHGAVAWMVLRDVLILTALGLALSAPAALGMAKLIESLLFGVKATDPVSLCLASGILLCAALLAGYLPARRASRIDPMSALRHE